MVKPTELKTGKNIDLRFLLPQKTEHELKRGLLHDHNYANKDHSQVQTEMPHESFLISPIKVHPPSLDDIHKKANEIKRKLFLSESDVLDVEIKTRGQSETAEWNLHRKYRITASKCHRVASLKTSTSPTKTVQEILQ